MSPPVHPATSQPNPEDFVSLYREYCGTADGIVSIHVSSKISGVYNSASMAKKSRERRYPDDWVFEHVEKHGVKFDYGRDYTECGAQNLYHLHNADEFLPYP